MSIRFSLEGIPVETSTAAEAVELIRAFKAAAADGPVQPVHPDRGHQQNGYVAPAGAHSWAKDFLLEIRNSGSAGARTEQIAEALGVESTKGIGGKLAIINRVIEHTGFKPQDTYNNDRTPEGRFWKPRPKIDAAIAALEQRGAQ
jgi:hypothetical protein